MPAEFYDGTDWQGSSGPIISRQFDASVDLWPHGAASEIGGGDKDVLEDGLHPILAIGAVGNKPNNLTGVVISYESDADLAILNVADKFISQQYVANILTYSGAAPNTWAATYVIGQAVFIDNSAGLTAGVTLSLSPLDQADAPNPLAGYLMYCQDEYYDAGVGGYNQAAVWPKTASNQELVESLLCVMQVNDSGQSRALITE